MYSFLCMHNWLFWCVVATSLPTQFPHFIVLILIAILSQHHGSHLIYDFEQIKLLLVLQVQYLEYSEHTIAIALRILFLQQCTFALKSRSPIFLSPIHNRSIKSSYSKMFLNQEQGTFAFVIEHWVQELFLLLIILFECYHCYVSAVVFPL